MTIMTAVKAVLVAKVLSFQLAQVVTCPCCVCRVKFLQLLSSQPKAPMVLQESSEVTIRMDDQDTPVQLQQLRMRQGQETVGLKLQVQEEIP